MKRLPYGINHLNDVIREGELTDPSVIFDVGANIGQTSTYLRRAFCKSEIYAFEPVGSTYRELVENVSEKEVKAFNIGFGEKKEKLKVFLQNTSGLNSLVETLNKPTGSGEIEEVELSTIDSFCREKHISEISILKIDTEGFGLKVLHGSKDLLKKGAIKSVFIEVGFDDDDKRHDNFFEVNRVLRKYSFRLFGFYDQWIENSRLEYCNALFILENEHKKAPHYARLKPNKEKVNSLSILQGSDIVG
jgi:FkbM family methyltransferase